MELTDQTEDQLLANVPNDDIHNAAVAILNTSLLKPEKPIRNAYFF